MARSLRPLLPGRSLRRLLAALAAGVSVLSAPAGAQRARQPVSELLVQPVRIDAVAPDITVRVFGMRDGLPQGTVLRLERDPEGYVWGATFGGIFRFDGQQLLSFDARGLPAIDANGATMLASASDGSLYFGTAGGRIGRLDHGRLVDTLPSPPPDRHVGVNDLLDDGRGTLWVRIGERVVRYRAGTWERLPGYPPIWTRFIRARDGTVLWAGIEGVVRARGEQVDTLARFLPPGGARDFQESDLRLDPVERPWFSTPFGVRIVERGQLMPLRGSPRETKALLLDRTGTMWIGAEDGLYRVRRAGGVLSALTIEPVVRTSAAILSLVETVDGVIVAGTRGDGFFLVRAKAVSVRRTVSGDWTGEATSVIGDGGDGIWFAAGCSAVGHLSASRVLDDSIPRPQDRYCVKTVARDARGRLWMGIDGVVRRQDPSGRVTDWPLEPWRGGLNVPRPILTVADTAFIGLADGRVARLGPDDRLTYLPEWSVPDGQPIESLAHGPDGALWIGQTGRFARVLRGRTNRWGRAHGVPEAVPRVLHPLSATELLIGTYGAGLLHVVTNPGRPHLLHRVPLVDNTVSAIVDDGRGNLWLSGNRGLTVLDRESLNSWMADSSERPFVRVFGTEDGVAEANYGQPAGARLADGRLAFGTVLGLMEVDPRLAAQAETPEIRIDAIRGPRGFQSLDSALLRFASDERVIDVSFSVPAFRYADQLQVRYRLEGRDADWIARGNTRQLQLVGMAPGRFRLRIEARVPGGAWRAAPPIAIQITPTLLERRALRLGVVLLIFIGFGLYARQRVRAVEADARAREIALQARREAAEQAERHQREIAQVNRVAVAGELTASLSHELGQPLAAIVNNAEVARRLATRPLEPGQPPDPLIDEALRDVVAQGRRASQVVREFRRFLRREEARREALAVEELVESARLLLRQEFADAGVALSVRVEREVPPVEAERVLLQQVLVNLLQNGLEASRGKAGGQVLLRARAVARGVRFTVADSGAGVSAAVRRTAFEPFVTSRPGGMGMGLAIARRIVEAHGGTIGIGRLPGGGAVVSFRLPTRHGVTTPVHLVPAQVGAAE